MCAVRIAQDFTAVSRQKMILAQVHRYPIVRTQIQVNVYLFAAAHGKYPIATPFR